MARGQGRQRLLQPADPVQVEVALQHLGCVFTLADRLQMIGVNAVTHTALVVHGLTVQFPVGQGRH